MATADKYVEHDATCGMHRIGICSCGLLATLSRETNPAAVYPNYNADLREHTAALRRFPSCTK